MRRTGSDVVGGAPELQDGIELGRGECALCVELHAEVEEGVGEVGGVGRGIGLEESLAGHVVDRELQLVMRVCDWKGGK